jgi:hypothetical protein
MFANGLGTAAIAVGVCLGAAAPAVAETALDSDQDMFGGLTCNCSQEVPPADSLLSEINRGLQHAGSAGLPGPTTPIEHG